MGSARYLDIFAFGTDDAIKKFMRNALLDEKIGGAIQLDQGNS